MISPSLKHFPYDPNVKEECSFPWGLCIQPFAKHKYEQEDKRELPSSAKLSRCSKCFAYINPFVKFKVGANKEAREWLCCLCNTLNPCPEIYKNVASESDKFPELKKPFAEYHLVQDEAEGFSLI